MKEAQEWSEYQLSIGQMQHAESEKRNGNGENLAWIFNSAIDFEKEWDTTAPQRWYDEIKDYDYETGESKNSNPVGHFT